MTKYGSIAIRTTLMRPRKALIEIFSTFLQFEDDRAQKWVSDPRLNRNMARSLQAEPESSETFWQVYWWQRYDRASSSTTHSPTSLQAVAHLSAYLQETCFWSVQRVMPRIGSIAVKISDCFQVAIGDLPRLLQSFDASRPYSLKTYANTVFGNTLRDYLRQRREVDFCSDWGLLLKISRKRLRESLQINRFDSATSDRYELAWKCLTAHHCLQKSPKLRGLTAPDAETWSAIVQMYNRDRQQIPHRTTDATAVDLEQWLLDAAQKVRRYLYPPVSSLNQKRGEAGDREWQDDLSAGDETPMTQLLEWEAQDERQAQAQQMVTVLKSAIAQLDPTAQRLLKFYYQERLTQQLIAQKLELQQYSVSRHLTRTRATLLKTIVAWSQNTLHISPTSEMIDATSIRLEEWLESFDHAAEHD
jgi:RNA polymerase sigma factor (sigma-70 family)